MRNVWVWVFGPKICHAGMVKFSDLGSNYFRWLYGIKWYRTSHVRHFYLCGWGKDPKFETYWAICKFFVLVRKTQNNLLSQNFQILGKKGLLILWFQMIKNSRHFIFVEWINKQKCEIHWEFCKFAFLVQNKIKPVMPAWLNFQIWDQNIFNDFYGFKW